MSGSSSVERGGQLEGRAGAQHQAGRGLLLPRAVQRELPGTAGLVAQLLFQVPDGQVAEVERALPGQGQVGGERGVAAEAGQLPAAGGNRVHGALGVVQGFGERWVGEPGGERAVVGGRELGGVEVGAVAIGSGDREAGHVARAAPPGSGESHPGPFGSIVFFDVSLEPLLDLVGAEHRRLDLEAGGGDGRGGLAAADAAGQRGVQALAQHAELERVEQLVDLLAVPLAGQHVARRGLGDAMRGERDVADERGQLPVAQYVGQVLAQGVASLALDLVDAVDQVF